jgi:hypothetical protein
LRRKHTELNRERRVACPRESVGEELEKAQLTAGRGV